LCRLWPGKGEGGIIESTGLNGLDFNRNPQFSECNYEIYLTAPDSHVSCDEMGSAAHEEPGSQRFTGGSQFPPIQSCTPGSSSSMFTSLNVSTRTLFRNRAGRYMSHTQASSSSTSKCTDPSSWCLFSVT